MKNWDKSKTIGFFMLVLVGGGLDLINNLITQPTLDVRSVLLVITGLVGIGLRIVTKEGISYNSL